MRGVPGLRAFLTDAVEAVDRRRLARVEHEVDGCPRARGAQQVPFATASIRLRGRQAATARPRRSSFLERRRAGVFSGVEHRRPVVIPHVVARGVGTGETRPAARQLLGISVALTLLVAHREMGHVQIADRPPRRVGGRVIDADAEERDLVTETAAFARLDIAGVVPPLDLVIGMARVVTRELEFVARGCLFPLFSRYGWHARTDHEQAEHCPWNAGTLELWNRCLIRHGTTLTALHGALD